MVDDESTFIKKFIKIPKLEHSLSELCSTPKNEKFKSKRLKITEFV